MSVGNINILFNLWALNMEKHNEFGPFTLYEQMYLAIDNIKHGNAPWKILHDILCWQTWPKGT